MKKESYDVVVIGSGMGGMCTAALLSHAGYRTLVVEKMPLLGGRCSTIDYKGFKLTTGAIAIETGGVLEEVFREVGAEFEVHPHPQPYYRIGGKDYQLPEKGGLRALISHAGGEREAERVMGAIRRGMAWIEPSNTISFGDWLRQYTQNEHVTGIFRALVATIPCLNMEEFPAGEFFRLLGIGYGGAALAPKGNLILIESLVKVVRAQGGEVWTRCPARHILVTDGLAEGVVVQRDGEQLELESKAVVSDAGPGKTVELAGSQNFDQGYLREMGENLIPAPYIWISIASDRPLMDYPGNLMLGETRRPKFIGCPTLLCPELAPPGKHLLYCGSVLRSALPPFDLKKEMELSIQDLRDNLPGFERHAEILIASCFYGEWPIYRKRPGYIFPQKTSVENLYNVGDGVAPAGYFGLLGCAQTARIVAENIKSRFRE
jgi:phytoene dehydrogenase-like protein